MTLSFINISNNTIINKCLKKTQLLITISNNSISNKYLL